MRKRPAKRGATLGFSVAILSSAVFGSSAAYAAKEIDTLVRLSHQRNNETLGKTEGTFATLNVNWARPVSSTISWRFSFRYLTSSQEALFGLQPLLTTTNNLVEPRYELRWTPKNYELSLGARWSARRFNPDNSAAAEQRENDLFARFKTSFENRPQLLVEWDRRIRDSNSGPETLNSRLLGTVSYQGDGWKASGGTRHTVVDTRGLRQREGEELLFDASFSRPFAAGRASTFASVSLTDIASTDTLAVQTLVPIPRVVLAGLSALDPVPDDGALNATPALIDGNRGTATAVNIGGGLSGGEIGWNVGFELALQDPVDVIDVWLADPIPAVNAVTYQWEVYRSDDNQTWTRLPGIATRTYDESDGRFRLIFQPTTARFVKIVNISVDDALAAVFVSEIEIFGRELREGRSQSETRTEIATASVSWTPGERITLSVAGFHNRIESGPVSRTTESRDDSANINIGFRASKHLLGNLTYGNSRRRRTLLPTEDTERAVLTLTATPVRDLELSTVANYRTLGREGETGRPELLSHLLRVATLLYRDLSLSAEYGQAHEESFDAPSRSRESIRAVLDTRPRPELQFNSSYALERIETPSLPAPDRREDVINWTNRLIIRPSSVLNLIAQGTYFSLATDSGWATVFQLDWLPFQGGAIQLSLDYRNDVPLAGQARKIRSASLRWNLNRRMFIDVEAGRRVREIEGAASRTQSLLTVFFQGRF